MHRVTFTQRRPHTQSSHCEQLGKCPGGEGPYCCVERYTSNTYLAFQRLNTGNGFASPISVQNISVGSWQKILFIWISYDLLELEWLIWLTCYISFHYICVSGHSSSIQYISNTFFHSRLITVDSNLLYTFYIVYSIDVLLYVLLTCNALFTCCQLGINNIYIKQSN